MYQVRLTTYAGGELEVATSRLCMKSPPSDIEDVEIRGSNSPSAPLDYSSQLETASRVRRSGFGDAPLRLTKFTRQASRTIQRCARALDEYASTPSEILFFTGTLPGTGADKYESIAKFSSYIVHRLKAWVAKRIPNKFDFYCWELQKRGALHIHYAVYCPDAGASDELLTGFKYQWIRLLKTVSDETGCNLFMNERTGKDWYEHQEIIQAKAERVTKSVGAYLGKYLSKSSRGHVKQGRFSPCRWWGCSRPLRELEMSMREEHLEVRMSPGGVIEFANDVLTFAGNLADTSFRWLNKVGHGVGGRVFGMLPLTLQTVLKIVKKHEVFGMRLDMKLYEQYCRLHEVIQMSAKSQPHWWSGFSRNSGYKEWLDYCMSQTAESLRQPDGICRLQAFVWRLEETLKKPTLFSGFRLDERWTMVILGVAKQVRDVLEEVYQDEYYYHKREDFTSLMEARMDEAALLVEKPTFKFVESPRLRK